MRGTVRIALAGFLTTTCAAFASDVAPGQTTGWQEVATFPDWSGIWVNDAHTPQISNPKEIIPLTPPYAKKMAASRAVVGGDHPAYAYHCMPRGVPALMESAFRAYEFLFTPGLLTITPQNNEVRFVYMDGRRHTPEVKPSYNGHSIGHWEGATLIVDTVSVKRGSELFYGFTSAGDRHVVERFHREGEKLINDKTLEDSAALSQPYSYRFTATRNTTPIREEICLQNNRDLDPVTGKQYFNLTPPPELKM